jgi:hypothetical protein
MASDLGTDAGQRQQTVSWDPRNPNHCPCCDSREPCVHQGATRPAHIAWREGRRAAEDYLQGAAPTPAGLEHEAPVSPYAETDDEHVWWSRAFSARTAQIRFARTFEWIGPEVPPDIEAAINRLIAKAHARGVASARLDQTATASVDYQRCGDETTAAKRSLRIAIAMTEDRAIKEGFAAAEDAHAVSAMTDEQINAELRTAGVDPDAVIKRAEVQIRALIAKRAAARGDYRSYRSTAYGTWKFAAC